MKPSWNFAKTGLGGRMSICSQLSGYIERHPVHACQAKPPPFSYYPVVTAAPRWTPPHQAPTTRVWKYDIISLLTKVKPFAKCRTFAKTCSIAMSRDDSDESTRTLGSNAPLPEPE